jgi:predicted ATPase/DNA-binding winged helix-turn-helix (wHTH) protein
VHGPTRRVGPSKRSRQAPGADDEEFSFGPYRLIPSRRLLLEGGSPVRLGSRALSLLVGLVTRAGATVSKDELLATVWPDTTVDEANLRVHVAALRKALRDGSAGARYITNVPLRGYCFVAPVVRTRASALASTPPVSEMRESQTERTSNRTSATALIGRDTAIAMLESKLETQRLISVVGAAGIGKTAVALAVGDRVAGAYADGVRFVDLASLSDPNHVPSALAGLEGVSLPADAPLEALVRELAGKEMLVLLDNCEHVIEAAAQLAERLIAGVPGARILATSRESLRAHGESVYRLPPLALPPSSSDRLTAAEAMTFPAVALFVERARASVDTFELTDADAPVVVELCRRLDGIPLAIELAAARVDTFGLQELMAHLDGRVRLLIKGPRTAIPRQQTLRGAMDWSYETLSERERWLLRRLSVFRSSFGLASAAALASDNRATDPPDELMELVAKSLVAADMSGQDMRYRLLATTRAYAFEKLVEAGEDAAALRCHAHHVRDLAERMAAAWSTEGLRGSREEVAIDDVRAALEWAYSDNGDPALGFATTLAAIPLAARLSLHAEFRAYAIRALEHASRAGTLERDTEMKLAFGLGGLSYHTLGEGDAAFRHAYRIATSLDPASVDRTPGMEGMWANFFGKGEYLCALELARELQSETARSKNPAAVVNGQRILGLSLHFIGEHERARELLERVASDTRPLALTNGTQIPFCTSAKIILARTLWIQGHADRARELAREAIDAATTANHVISLCYALGYSAIPIATWRGDLEHARDLLQVLIDQSARGVLRLWQRWGRALATALDHAPSASAGRDDELTDVHLDMLGTLRADLVTERALERAESGLAGWCAPEIFRARGEMLLRSGAEDAPEHSAALFLRAAELARRQGALAWELRAVTSLARLRHDEGRTAEARALLAPVLDRFREGHSTRDVVDARTLLAMTT